MSTLTFVFTNTTDSRYGCSESLKAYRTVLTVSPDNVEAHFNMGCSLEELGDLTGAAQVQSFLYVTDLT